MTAFSIKIISDVVCPFCYLGKKRLEKAISLYKTTIPGAADDRFSISWLPFYLDPEAPKTGVPIKERLAQKFGADRVGQINANMRKAGVAEGIDFTFAGKAGNTRDAHRLVQLAKLKKAAAQAGKEDGGPDLEDAVVSSLFRSYFEEGGDVTSHDMLVAAAARAGLDANEARTWLAGDGGGDQVDAEVSAAYQRGVHGVPHFIINDKFEVGGAQDPQVFVGEFLRAKQEGSTQ
ncbi:dsba-like thioredoxin domain containing protein [Niveomyces insectorum RCEF 264]|uniref:Dsba-like thioredoxin domain containing protein n=1 Tax=Niveomyces insectorum RCEF 264 TaxID=1081102 RepID=A0A167X8X2_9HYPO|nr:dsba-like thioredoxin domain containing protein [Niveomyces insectorum RCEF 264]